MAADVIATLASCPVPEVARLGRTLKAWWLQILAHLHHRRRLYRRHRGRQRADREDPPHRPRLPQLQQLPITHPGRHRRLTSMATEMTTHAQPRRARFLTSR